jgi:hypothetical protein
MLAMMAANVEHVITYWVLWQKFHSPSLTGFEVISHWPPFLVLSPYFGALAGRHDCRKLIQGAQGLFMAVSACWGLLPDRHPRPRRRPRRAAARGHRVAQAVRPRRRLEHRGLRSVPLADQPLQAGLPVELGLSHLADGHDGPCAVTKRGVTTRRREKVPS